jgi:hypothetical protein
MTAGANSLAGGGATPAGARPTSQRRPQGPGPWRSARPELAIALAVLAACAVSAWAVAGGPGTALVAVSFCALSLAVVNRLLVPDRGPPPKPDIATGRRLPSGAFISYWRRRAGLTEAMASIASYRVGLGPDLEHLLAARLSERHGVSLYHEPDRARSLLCPRGRDIDLWPWVDPGHPLAGRTEGPGIPRRTLMRLVEAMERL